ncbi:hypothetical protein QBC40DRAFT_256497 [Triangularia verruculosa]|uniref:MACPF domain-containing protein n=1 Tax=Triangularia verruculosa TaxID=2587418 RepID=A0AAN7AR23_9PEZI|nr:hypothetical protein QBC40DRAFT_256497 [Triangularia verruculosa]
MGLVDDFPDDPFTPSVRYAATCQLPVHLPWGRDFIKLGSSLSISRQKEIPQGHLDGSKSAFSQPSLEQSRLVLAGGARGQVIATDTSGTSSFRSHTDFSISGQIGGSFIGASGRAKYEASASRNNSNLQSSFRTTYCAGSIRFAADPLLSPHALSLLTSSKDPRKAEEAFRAVYGEYYVAAYILGGANATLLAGNAADEAFASHLRGSFTVKIAFIKINESFEEREQRGSAAAGASLTGYDSLEGADIAVKAIDVSNYSEVIQGGVDNRNRGNMLPERVEQKTREMGLKFTGGRDAVRNRDPTLSWGKCGELCQGGLVTELLLLPWSGLREYIVTMHRLR